MTTYHVSEAVLIYSRKNTTYGIVQQLQLVQQNTTYGTAAAFEFTAVFLSAMTRLVIVGVRVVR